MPIIKVHPEGWKPAKGYANGMIAEGRMLFIAGQIGWDAEQKFQHHDFFGQMKQSLMNVAAVLQAAGGKPEDLVRMTWYVTDKKFYSENQKQVGEVYRSIFGYHFPTMTMIVVSALTEDEALVEIEATAVLPTD